MPEAPPIILSIAGFDPSSGAGVTADIKTIAAHRCYGVGAITALTVQSSAGVRRVVPVDQQLLTDSLDELARDVKVSAVHIGMLGGGQVAAGVADFLASARLPNVVLDPVIRSSSGAALLEDDAIGILVERLLPLADVITPNVDEAAFLTGREVKNPEHMKAAAARLHKMGARSVIITGGHLGQAVDVLSESEAGFQVFRSDRLNSPNTHGTGCAFSTALACQLALGRGLPLGTLLAKAYVLGAITTAYSIGHGPGPVNHMYGKVRKLGGGEPG